MGKFPKYPLVPWVFWPKMAWVFSGLEFFSPWVFWLLWKKKACKCAKLRSRPLCWRGTPSGFEIYSQRLEMVESCLSSNHSTNLQAPGISPEGSHLIVRSSIRLRGAKITFTVLSSLPFSTKYHPHWPSSHGCDLSGDPLWKWCKCGSLEAQTSGQGTQD